MPGPGVLPVHQVFGDERFVRTGAFTRVLSGIVAGHGAALRAFGTIQKYRRRGADSDGKLPARRGCARRAAILRHCRPPAICGTERPDRGGTSARSPGRRAQPVCGISGAAGSAVVEARIWTFDSHEDRPRRACAAGYPPPAHALWYNFPGVATTI